MLCFVIGARVANMMLLRSNSRFAVEKNASVGKMVRLPGDAWSTVFAKT